MSSASHLLSAYCKHFAHQSVIVQGLDIILCGPGVQISEYEFPYKTSQAVKLEVEAD